MKIRDRIRVGVLAIIVFAIGMIGAGWIAAARASDSPWAVNLYGASYHTDRRMKETENLNERNYGAGLRYYVNDTTFIEGGEFADSMNGKSRFIGIAYQANAGPFSIGVEPFFMTRPNYNGGKAFMAALPFASLKIRNVTTSVTYTPYVKVDDQNIIYETYAVYTSIRF